MVDRRMSVVRKRTLIAAGLAAAAAACSGAAADAAPYGYVDDFRASRVSQYDLANGGLKPLKPAHVAVGDRPNPPVLTPDGLHVYVPNAGAGFISQFAVDPRGRLRPLTPPAVANSSPTHMAVTSNGRFAYVISFSDTVTEYAIRPNGALQPIGTTTVPPTEEEDPAFLNDVTLSRDERHAYVAEGFILGRGTIHQYDIGSDGRLTPMSPARVPVPTTPLTFAVAPKRPNLYAAGNSSIFQYAIRPNGALKPLDPGSVAVRSPGDPTVSPNGRNLYAAAQGDEGLWQFAIAPGGALSPLSPPLVPAGSFPASVRLTESGRWAYAVNAGNLGKNSSIGRYAVRKDGRLTRLGPLIPKSGAPVGIAITPDVANLELSVQAKPAHPDVGDQVTFSLTARNFGPATARGVVVSDRLPARLAFKRVSAGASCTHADDLVTCRLPRLAGGVPAKFAITVTAKRSGPASDAARVSARQRDLHRRDNRAHATVRVGKPAR